MLRDLAEPLLPELLVPPELLLPPELLVLPELELPRVEPLLERLELLPPRLLERPELLRLELLRFAPLELLPLALLRLELRDEDPRLRLLLCEDRARRDGSPPFRPLPDDPSSSDFSSSSESPRSSSAEAYSRLRS